ncbi:MAG: mechanosensitive ion channel family protein [Gammaproteobacteria bacterium]|nr:mechanosensitive ion channel family protein [Gammaproteobacteria bacterium]MDH5629599.1 mechanosensitive ion channel family protein [Gammaproteobacteria bacterium]
MNWLIIAGIIVAYMVSAKLISAFIAKFGKRKNIRIYRIKYISKTIKITLMFISIFMVLMFLGVKYSQVTVFISSVFAVAGIALFAQWSILSNITASLIIFFAFPYRMGDKIKIVDSDDEIVGVIEEITLFHVIIRRGEDLITYPNSLILQKAVIKQMPQKKEKKVGTETTTEQKS